MAAPRPWVAVVVLSVMCWVGAFVGIDGRPLVNWQESMRALVARDMDARGDWVVPEVAGRAYLAKPPMVYWAQNGIADARRAVGLGDGSPGEVDLRLTVALFGWLGVLGTYWCARRLLGDVEEGRGNAGLVDAGSFWASAMLASGVLYVRSSRMGEIDIMLVAPTALGVVAMHAAWTRWRDAGRVHVVGLLGALVCGALIALAKGPPGMAAGLAAGVLGPGLYRAAHGGRLRGAGLWALGGAAVFAALAARAVDEGRDAIGVVLMAGIGAAIVPVVAWLMRPSALREMGAAFVVGGGGAFVVVGLWALSLWGRAVDARLGDGALVSEAASQAEHNLNFLMPGAVMNLAEGLSYGLGIGGACAVVGGYWLCAHKPRLERGWFVVLAWAGLGLAVYTLMGKGTLRYFLPAWPGVAMVAGLWFAAFLRDVPGRSRLAVRIAGVGVGVLVAAQGVYYARVAAVAEAERSPRALLAELEVAQGVSLDRVRAVDFWTPALDYESGQHIEGVLVLNRVIDSVTVPTRLEGLAEGGGRYVLLMQDRRKMRGEVVSTVEAVRSAGWAVERIEARAVFRKDRGDEPFDAYWAWPMGGGL